MKARATPLSPMGRLQAQMIAVRDRAAGDETALTTPQATRLKAVRAQIEMESKQPDRPRK